MSVNLNCCPNFNLGLESLCSCKKKPETESPSPSPPPAPGPASTRKDEIIVLVENEQIQFENLVPKHLEYLYLKILKNKKILFAFGKLMDNFGMTDEDFNGIDICSISKYSELFGGCICPLISKTLDQGTAYQFCFKLGSSKRLFCCSIYPCYIPEQISSVDCVIRPVISGFKPSLIEKYVLPLERDNKGSGGWKIDIV